MKHFLFILVSCMVCAQPLQAQRSQIVKRGAQELLGADRQVLRSLPRVSATTRASVGTAATARGAVSTPGTAAHTGGSTTATALQVTPGTTPMPNTARHTLAHHNLPDRQAAKARVEQLTLAHADLVADHAHVRDGLTENGFGRSVLFAPVEGKEGGFSVTAFKTNHNGQEEIYGVIASHVLPESFYTYSVSLHRQFNIQLRQADGSDLLLPAEVVQVSPRSMLDISLVKFSPEAEPLLQPLTLAQEPAQPGELLSSYGFADGEEQQVTRTVMKNSFISVRTDQNLHGKRFGFCGSPLLDINQEIKAIHTGTLEGKNSIADVSYGTHAGYINLLVEAYHNGGEALYDLVLDGQTFARLNVDEYISAVSLYDGNGKRILQRNWDDKFSQSAFLKLLEENPQAGYVQLTSRKTQWETDNDGDSILRENRTKTDKTKRQHWYNLQTQQMEPVRPAIIKI